MQKPSTVEMASSIQGADKQANQHPCPHLVSVEVADHLCRSVLLQAPVSALDLQCVEEGDEHVVFKAPEGETRVQLLLHAT